MKNKIIALILSAALLCSCFAICASATNDSPAPITSGIFSLTAAIDPESAAVDFSVNPEELPQVTIDYFNGLFDDGKYDATFYGAYRVSFVVDGADAAFTSAMGVTVNLGDAYAENEIFVIYVTNDNTASDKVKATREGKALVINGADFEAMTDSIIIVMTSNKNIAKDSTSPVIPAVICAGVAVIAIAATVIIVKKKNVSDNIID